MGVEATGFSKAVKYVKIQGENMVSETKTETESKGKGKKTENKWQSSKTSCISHLPDANYWHYSLQLNTYKYILENNYGKKINKMYLVILHPNNKGGTYIKYLVNHLNDEMGSLIELRRNTI